MMIKKNSYSKIFILLILLSCSGKNESYTVVNNESPLYKRNDYVSIENIHNIELLTDTHEIAQATGMAAGSNNFLYVLGQYESELTVFDENGQHIRTMGKPGEGPQDLYRPIRLSLYDKKFYIVEGFSGMKIWDLDGNYIDKVHIPLANYFLIKPRKNFFLTLSYLSSPNGEIHKYEISKASTDFKEKEVLFTYNLNRRTEFKFSPQSVLSFTNDNHFYFPENSSQYSIIKYNVFGMPVLLFKRDYKRTQFSKEAVDLYNKIFGASVSSGRLNPLPKYPPVIRKTFLDSYENVWVVSGEIKEDSGRTDFESTVDIFDEKGTWLYSFKTNILSYQSFIKNDRLYSVSNEDPVTGQQYINVYEIKYDSRNNSK